VERNQSGVERKMNPLPKITLGIDPGASGGIAAALGDTVLVYPMPATEGDILTTLESLTRGPACKVCYLEEVGGYIEGVPAPGSAMFNFGRNFGFLLGAIQAMGIRLVLVKPGKWQKSFSIGKGADCADKREWKHKLQALAQRLFPSKQVTLKTADALLIMEYGRQMENLK
jgi:crossover junction endodeoxyribonuclease RuvC